MDDAGSADEWRPGSEAAVSPQAVRDDFGRLANVTRLEILRTIADAEGPVAYADLLEELSVTDSGQCNYHLRQLRETFVDRTDAGYELTQTGLRAANLLAARSLQTGVERPFRSIDSRCGRCGGGAVEIGYRRGEGIVRCRSCDRQLTRFDFPPAAARSSSLEEFTHAFAQRTRRYVELLEEGVCPFCSHTMRRTVRPGAATHADSLPVAGSCSACSAAIRAPVGLALLNRPRVAAAFSEAGVSFSETPFWELGWCTFGAPTVHGTEPLVVAIETTIDGTEWRIHVDEDLTIRRFDRG